MLTPELIKELAPHARADYTKALTSDAGWEVLAHYKITSGLERLAGFFANTFHETGGLTILRESLNYKTPARLRQVWPSRFGKKSDAELLKLCGNEKALASIVYNGRMGNRPGTDDGYTFRGAGFLQTTGREDFIKYGKLAGIDFSMDPPPDTDDAAVLLLMAAAEWAAGRCNELCQSGNFPGACAVINVGSASKTGSVVGMAERQKWYRHITKVFSDYENILEAPTAPTAPVAPQSPPVAQQAPGGTAPGSAAQPAPEQQPGAASQPPAAQQPGAVPTSDGTSVPTGGDSQAAPPAAQEGTGEATTRGFGFGRPRLRRRSVSRAPAERHWYDFFTRWFKGPAKPDDLPAVILHPELAEMSDERGDPRYRHFTDGEPD